MISPEIAAKFDNLLDRMVNDPEGLIAELGAELLAEYGQEWFDANKKYLDNGWLVMFGQFGF